MQNFLPSTCTWNLAFLGFGWGRHFSANGDTKLLGCLFGWHGRTASPAFEELKADQTHASATTATTSEGKGAPWVRQASLPIPQREHSRISDPCRHCILLLPKLYPFHHRNRSLPLLQLLLVPLIRHVRLRCVGGRGAAGQRTEIGSSSSSRGGGQPSTC